MIHRSNVDLSKTGDITIVGRRLEMKRAKLLIMIRRQEAMPEIDAPRDSQNHLEV